MEQINTINDRLKLLFDQFKEFKLDFKRELSEFKNEVYRRFESIERRQDEDHKMLMELWQQRNEVTVKFSRFQMLSFGAVILTVGAIVSSVITLFIHLTL